MAGYLIFINGKWRVATSEQYSNFSGRKEMVYCETMEQAQSICLSMNAEQKLADEAIAFERALNA